MRNINLAILTGTALALSACMGIGGDGAKLNRSVDNVHQPIVERSQFVIDLNIDAVNGISPNEAERLDQWLGMLDVGYGDRVAVDFGSSYGNRRAEESIAQLAAKRGLLLSDAPPILSTPYVPGTARVVITRSTARVDGCPNWDKKAASNLVGSTHTNYGCATSSNIAAMIADPEDLARGRGSLSDDPRGGVRAIQDYQKEGPNYNAGKLGQGVSSQ